MKNVTPYNSVISFETEDGTKGTFKVEDCMSSPFNEKFENGLLEFNKEIGDIKSITITFKQ